MKKRRDKLSIMQDILIFIAESRGRAKPTNILYKSNLSYKMLNKYVEELILMGLVEEKKALKDKRVYNITKRGMGFLKDYELIKKFMDSYGFES